MAVMGGPIVHTIGLYLRSGRMDCRRGRQTALDIYGLLPVNVAISSVSTAAVKTTFFVFVAVFALFLLIEIRIMLKAIAKGPVIDEALPEKEIEKQ